MAIKNYPNIESANRSYKALIGEVVPNEAEGTVPEAIGSVDQILSEFSQVLEGTHPDDTLTLPTSMTNAVIAADLFGGGVVTTNNSYISGTGTAGVDNTAQTVKTLVLPANTLTQIGDRCRIRCYWIGDTGNNITGLNTVNGVTTASTTDAGAATFQVTESWLHYIDATHANIISMTAGALNTTISAANVAGFNFAIAQDVDLDQDQIVNNHIIVYFFAIDVFPKTTL